MEKLIDKIIKSFETLWGSHPEVIVMYVVGITFAVLLVILTSVTIHKTRKIKKLEKKLEELDKVTYVVKKEI